MPVLKGANLALRFFLELSALAAVGYWGYHVGHTVAARIGLAVAAPLLVAVVWGAFVAPAAAVAVGPALRLAIELAVFAAAIAALAATGQRTLAWALGITYAAHRVLMFVWRQ